MTSRYRVEYALKSHRRDEFIEWIKGLLAVPFVLHSDAENYLEDIALESTLDVEDEQLERNCQARYLDVFHDVEKLVDNTIYLDNLQYDEFHVSRSRLRLLVPSLGRFFTRLPLKEAFLIEDKKRLISRRRLVSPSFNDVRSILNTAQLIALTSDALLRLKLITFDGDVTLYEDGKSLTPDSPLVGALVNLLSKDLFVAVVTAAGYPGRQGAFEYHRRLSGLIEALRSSEELLERQKSNFLVMGGESNYLFRFMPESGNLEFIDGQEWWLPTMRQWDQDKLAEIMNSSYDHLKFLRRKFHLDDDSKTKIVRKERSLGIIPLNDYKIQRETLEEIVLSLLAMLDKLLTVDKPHPINLLGNIDDMDSVTEAVSSDIRACAFNGGSDVWVDIGDKALGVAALQRYLCQFHQDDEYCPIAKAESLHIGDQFASVGANDFRARLSACTAWIASPRETREILDSLITRMDNTSNHELKKLF